MKSRRISAGSLVLAGAMIMALAGCSSAHTAADPAPLPAPSSAPPAPPATPSSSPEDKARADLDALVRQYYDAENEVFLDPSLSPSAALEPFLMNPALGARIADILAFRNDGHVADSSTTEIHSIAVTEMALSASPVTATLEECGTVYTAGVDGTTGKRRAVSDRGLTVWTSRQLPDGTWRLTYYDNPPERAC